MKVGVIVTDSFHDIVEELKDAGIDINALTIQAGISLQAHQAIAVFMGDSQGYDLIHVIGSVVPLFYCRFIDAPMLVTLHKEPTEMEQNIYTSAPQNCYFVGAPGEEPLPGINTLPRLDASPEYTGGYYRNIYERIAHLHSRKDHRPWGFYEVISDEKDDHKIKRITLWPKKRLSLQLHKRRAEHWIIIAGQALVTLGDDTITLNPSESIDIPCGAAHRVENTGNELLVFIEVQQGDYFGEDDIIRLEDDFGRV